MAPRTWLLCLLLLGLVLPGASSRAHQHSMETRSECLAYGGQPLSPPIHMLPKCLEYPAPEWEVSHLLSQWFPTFLIQNF
jgi:hypothetical protein